MMVFIKLAQFFIFIVAIWIGVTQVFLPLLMGRPLFPYFRRGTKLERELAEARESVDEVKLEHEIQDVKQQADTLRHKLTSDETTNSNTDKEQPCKNEGKPSEQ